MSQTSLEALRAKAKELGVKGASRLGKARLEECLRTVVVYRQDRKAMAALKARLGREPWMVLKVAEWSRLGRGRWERFRPRAWHVPVSLLAEVAPISKEEADAIRDRRSAAGRKAVQTARQRDDEAAAAVGARRRSRLGRALRRGEIDPEEAELLAFKARFRHEFTDYEALLAAGFDREEARELRSETVPAVAGWDEYLARYGFDGEVAAALAHVLKDPAQAHPVWFCEAKLAVERAVPGDRLADPSGLSYELICQLIEDWREERRVGEDW